MTDTIHIDKGGPDTSGRNRCAMTWRYALCSCARCRALREAGEWTDMPPCAPPSMMVVQGINDSLSDAGRQRLAARIPLIPSLALDADPDVVDRVERRAALWAARSVEHLSDDRRVRACNDVTERWLAGEATDEEVAAARDAAWAAGAAGAAKAVRAARAARAAARGTARDAIWDAAGAATWAAALFDAALLDWLDRYLDAWAKIAADEGLMGACEWLDPADFVQVGGS